MTSTAHRAATAELIPQSVEDCKTQASTSGTRAIVVFAPTSEVPKFVQRIVSDFVQGYYLSNERFIYRCNGKEYALTPETIGDYGGSVLAAYILSKSDHHVIYLASMCKYILSNIDYPHPDLKKILLSEQPADF